METTRKYYEELLTHLEDICKLTTGKKEKLDQIKLKLATSIKKINQYHLFKITFTDEFSNVLESKTEDFDNEQSLLAKELYKCLGELLFTFEITSIRFNYSDALEICRTELPYKIISTWSFQIQSEFSMGTLFFQMNKKWLEIDNEEEYNNYKNELRTRIQSKINVEDDKIPQEKYIRLKAYFKKSIKEYRDYIFANYPEIADEFAAYNSNVRVYIIPQKKSNDSIVNQVNIYKNYDGNKVYIHPYYLHFISRFSNLEEIEQPIISGYMGLFYEDDLDKNHNSYSINNIHHELHSIFIRKANINDLRDYFLYLLRAQQNRILETDDSSCLIIANSDNKENCKLLFDNTPSIEQLSEILYENNELRFGSIALKNYPDKETIKYLEQLGVKYYILEEEGRMQVNYQNGQMIHWFIQSKVKNIATKNTSLFTPFSKGEQLITRLQNCPTGLKGWLEYENICTDIFSYLFNNNFRNYTYKTQSYTHDHIFRRDLIVNNNYIEATSFWATVKSDFNSNIIIVDFKNYAEPLEQNEFYLPSKYLNLTIGKFGILFSRKGISNSAKILQRRMFNRDKELIICLDDEDIIGMIKEKMTGQDPIYRLENQKFLLYELD